MLPKDEYIYLLVDLFIFAADPAQFQFRNFTFLFAFVQFWCRWNAALRTFMNVAMCLMLPFWIFAISCRTVHNPISFSDRPQRPSTLHPNGELRRGEGVGGFTEQDLREKQKAIRHVSSMCIHQRPVDMVSLHKFPSFKFTLIFRDLFSAVRKRIWVQKAVKRSMTLRLRLILWNNWIRRGICKDFTRSSLTIWMWCRSFSIVILVTKRKWWWRDKLYRSWAKLRCISNKFTGSTETRRTKKWK